MRVGTGILSAGVVLGLASCSNVGDHRPEEVWVMASSLTQPSVAYTPRPIISARETDAGMWVWHPQRAVAESMTVDRLLSQIAATKAFSPQPLVLFSFAEHHDSAERSRLRSRIAVAANCTRLNPCVEGTVEQLR